MKILATFAGPARAVIGQSAPRRKIGRTNQVPAASDLKISGNLSKWQTIVSREQGVYYRVQGLVGIFQKL